MKEMRKKWRRHILFACMCVISGSMVLPRTAHYSHFLAAGAFLVLSLLPGETRRMILGLSLCLVNVALAFVDVSRSIECGIYLVALAIGLLFVVADNRRKRHPEPYQSAA